MYQLTKLDANYRKILTQDLVKCLKKTGEVTCVKLIFPHIAIWNNQNDFEFNTSSMSFLVFQKKKFFFELRSSFAQKFLSVKSTDFDCKSVLVCLLF